MAHYDRRRNDIPRRKETMPMDARRQVSQPATSKQSSDRRGGNPTVPHASPQLAASNPKEVGVSLEDLLAICEAKEWIPQWMEDLSAPAGKRIHCELRRSPNAKSRTQRAPVQHGRGSTKLAALRQAMEYAGILSKNQTPHLMIQAGTDTDPGDWDREDDYDRPVLKRADHFDNYAYSRWPVDGRDD
jgi:hypothetical protein